MAAAAATANTFWFTVALPVAVGFPLATMQLFQSSHHRDAVDHAASLAADAVAKSLCANGFGTPRGTYAGPRQAYVEERVRSQLSLAIKDENCQISVRPSTSTVSVDPGSMAMEALVECQPRCTIAFGGTLFCKGSPRHLTMSASQVAVAMGCDAE